MESQDNSMVKYWKESFSKHVKKFTPFSHIDHIQYMASLFSPGHFYYYIFNLHNLEIEYIHPSVKEVLGLDPAHVTMPLLISQPSPEELVHIERKERFFQSFSGYIGLEKLPTYKLMYFYKLHNEQGHLMKTMMLQATVLSMTEEGMPQHVLAIHTDVSHFNMAHNDYVSMISLDGKKSYYNCDASTGAFDPKLSQTETSKISDLLSKREIDVVKLLAQGLSTTEVGKLLGISPNTIRTHRKNILKKTDCSNTTEVIAQCLVEGAIS